MKPITEGRSWDGDLPSAERGQSPLTQDDPRVIAALEAYLSAMEDGELPDRQEFLARHPAIGEPLVRALEGLDFIQRAAPRLEQDSREGLTPTSMPAAALDPGVPLGDYRILREVGRGGMGVVYEAVQLSLGRRVALKILPWAAAFDPRQLQRFRNEAQAAAQLHHTNIVPVFGVGSERGVHYYVMQFIDGHSLAQVIADLAKTTTNRAEQPAQRAPGDGQPASPVPESQIRPLPSALPVTTTPAAALSTERSIKSATFFRAVAQLGVQAAEALEHAHQLGVVHRDIKPGNLLLDLRGHVWITDFGLARCQSDNNLTLSGDLVGTLRYMSPEQALAKHWLLDHRTDIYSLGATLYELLTLEPVFRGRDREEILAKVAGEEPLRLKHWNKAIPAELETILLKALEKDAWNRYASARELAEDLQRFLNDQPIRARRPTMARIAAKWARRHRGIVLTAAVAAAMGLVLGIAGLLASNVRIRDEQARTEVARQRAVRNLALAMDALNRIYVRVAEERFLRDPQLQPEDRKLLALALDFYQELAWQNGDDPAVRQAVADACFRVGDIQKILGQPHPAKQAYERGLVLREQRVSDSPADYGCRAALAAGHHSLANVLDRVGDRGAAAFHYRQTLELWVRLGTDFPNIAQVRKMIAGSHTDLGVFMAVDGAWAAAEAQHRQAMALRVQLATDDPADPGFREDVANSHWNLGNVMAETGRSAEAETHYRQALELQSRLAAEFPEVPHYRQEEALSACNLATLLARSPNSDAARTYYHRALELRGRLAADFPSVPEYRSELAEAHERLGILLAEERKQADAVQHVRRALELRSRLVADFPDVLHYRQGLASVHGNLGSLLLTEEPATARQHLGKAIDLLDRLVAAESAVPAHRRGLAHANHNLGVVLEQAGECTAAASHYQRAIDLWTRLAGDVPAAPTYRYHLGIDHHSLGCLVYARGDREASVSHFRLAKSLWEPLSAALLNGSANRSESADVLDRLAQLLANCLEPAFRDPDRSVYLARKATDRSPRQEKYWSTLGLAYYRAGDPRAALDALKQANRLSGSRDVADLLVLAMVHWRLGEKAHARQCYGEAARFMASHRPGSEHLRRLDSEAAALLGIEKLPDEALPD